MKIIKSKMFNKDIEIVIPNARAFIELNSKYGNDKYTLCKTLLNLYCSPALELDKEIEMKSFVVEIGGSKRVFNLHLKEAFNLVMEIMKDHENPNYVKYAEKVLDSSELDNLTFNEFKSIYEGIVEVVVPVGNALMEIITPFQSI